MTQPIGITLTLSYPVSANAYWRNRVVRGVSMTYVTNEARSYKAEVGWLAKQAGVRKPILGRVALAYTLYPKRPQDWESRQRKLGEFWADSVQCIDLDNAQKVLLDALKNVAFDDDKWVHEIHARRGEPDAKGARIEVTITPLSGTLQGALL